VTPKTIDEQASLYCDPDCEACEAQGRRHQLDHRWVGQKDRWQDLSEALWHC
jgi:hypothetical protein